MNPTSMLNWWPRVSGLDIPMPETEIIEIGHDAMIGLCDGDSSGIVPFTSQIQAVAERIGYPLFLRTDLASGKHDWENTCFVQRPDDLLAHIVAVVEDNEMGWLDYRAIVIREYVQMDTAFTAFYGNLPIGRERRYFVCDEEIECHHPYWPADAFERHTPSVDNWEEVLVELSIESADEVSLLTAYAIQVAACFEGYWSVDFCRAADGVWYFIDMAEGDKSWHPACVIADAR